EEVKERVNKISPNIEILSGIYINAGTKLECKCLIDGCVWHPTWGSLSQGHGCPVCGGSKNLTLDIIKERLLIINLNIEILSDTYINTKTI
ncbi:MAG TPA: hypothetical protein VIK86_04215, partial [Candidatus Paceibacterota bacterium]